MEIWKYEKYPDVRHNLAWYAVFATSGAGFVALRVVLPPSVHARLKASIGQITDFTGNADFTALALFTALAVFFIEVVKIHDLYDKYVIRWRDRYDLDFILPRLIRSLRRLRAQPTLETSCRDGRTRCHSGRDRGPPRQGIDRS